MLHLQPVATDIYRFQPSWDERAHDPREPGVRRGVLRALDRHRGPLSGLQDRRAGRQGAQKIQPTASWARWPGFNESEVSGSERGASQAPFLMVARHSKPRPVHPLSLFPVAVSELMINRPPFLARPSASLSKSLRMKDEQ